MLMFSISRAFAINKVTKYSIFSTSRMLHSSISIKNNSNNLSKNQTSKISFEEENCLKTTSELEDKFLIYLKNLIVSVHSEKESVLERERLLNSNLPEYLQELRSLSIFNLKIDRDFYAPCNTVDFKLKLVRRKAGQCMPSGGWRKGMLVSLQVDDGGESRLLEPWMKVDGILEDVGSTFIVVSLYNLQGWVLEHLRGRQTSTSQSIRIVKRSEETLYTNSIKQLNNLLKNVNLLERSKPGKLIFQNILGVETEETSRPGPEEGRREDVLTVYNKALLSDESKMSALTLCSERQPLTLLHGPPGTGKTTTLAAAVLSAVKNGDRVLVVAPSHAACDAVVAALTQCVQGVSLVRLGNRLRLTSPDLEIFLPENLQHSPGLEKIVARLSWVRGQLLDGNRGRGELIEEERRLVEQYRGEYRDHEDRVMKEVKIVVCTLHTSSRPAILKLARHHFDLVCVDEAGFSLDNQVLPIMTRAQRLILAGDHLQLPPVVLSAEARNRGLAVSLFEALVSSLQSCVALLSVQYRSNKIISGWSSQQFYDNLLTANSTNAEATLSQMVGRKPLSEYQDSAWLLSNPLVWLDTKDKEWEEDVEDEESISNIGEAVMVANVVTVLIKVFGVSQHDIGVISPYWAQVALVRNLLWETDNMTGVEVKTVDGYQGREKSVILLSLVRSNAKAEVGFLSESRRINVSVTRARRSCIIIGDSNTLRCDTSLDSLWRYCQQLQTVTSVDKINL